MRQYNTAVRFTEYGSDTSFEWKSDDIEVTAPAQTGWINSWRKYGNRVIMYYSTYNAVINDDL